MRYRWSGNNEGSGGDLWWCERKGESDQWTRDRQIERGLNDTIPQMKTVNLE